MNNILRIFICCVSLVTGVGPSIIKGMDTHANGQANTGSIVDNPPITANMQRAYDAWAAYETGDINTIASFITKNPDQASYILYLAIRQANISCIDRLIGDKLVDLNKPYLSTYPLARACKLSEGKQEYDELPLSMFNIRTAVDLLLSGGAQVNAQDEQGYTPLMYAIQNKTPNLGVIASLLNTQNIDLDIRNNENKSALDFCMNVPNEYFKDIVTLLFIKNNIPDIDITNGSYRQVPDAIENMCKSIANKANNVDALVNPFLLLCNRNDLTTIPTINFSIQCIELLLPALENTQHPYYKRAYKCAKALLERSVHIANQDYTHTINLIKKSIETKNEALLELLVCNVHMDTYIFDTATGDTALHLCVRHNFHKGIPFLCKSDDNKLIEMTNKDGDTPLICAIKLDKPECVTALLNHRCNPGGTSTVALANEYCKKAVVSLENAQRITFYHLPNDMLNHIASFAPDGGSVKDRFKTIGTLSECCKTLYHSITDLIRDSKKQTTEETTKFEKYQGKIYLASKHLSDDEMSNALWAALHHSNFTLFSILLTQNPHLVNSINPSYGTFLEWIANCHPDKSLIELLVKTGVNINNTVPYKWVHTRRFSPIENIELAYDINYKMTPLDILFCKICNLDYRYPDHQNAIKNLVECAEYLLQQGGKFSEQIPYFNTDYVSETTDLKSMLGVAIFNCSPAQWIFLYTKAK